MGDRVADLLFFWEMTSSDVSNRLVNAIGKPKSNFLFWYFKKVCEDFFFFEDKEEMFPSGLEKNSTTELI